MRNDGRTRFGTLTPLSDGSLIIEATEDQAETWAGTKNWPVSKLVGLGGFWIKVDEKNDLVDASENLRHEDVSAVELNAWESDVREAAARKTHPEFFKAAEIRGEDRSPGGFELASDNLRREVRPA